MQTSPTASEITVLERAPLRTFTDSRPGPAWCFSYPRCSVISSFSAVSSTFFVNSFSSPPGPVSSRPRCRASATIAAAAACSGDSCRPSSLLSLLCAFTASDVITHSAHPAGPQPGVSGRKHRSLHSPDSGHHHGWGVEEVKSGDWGIGGNPLSTAGVKALAAGQPVG